MSTIVDDKSEHCVPFILKSIQKHQQAHKKTGEDVPPFFIGLNGVQGAGKTTLVGRSSFHNEHCLIRPIIHSFSPRAFITHKPIQTTDIVPHLLSLSASVHACIQLIA